MTRTHQRKMRGWVLAVELESALSHRDAPSLDGILSAAAWRRTGDPFAELPLARLDADGSLLPPGPLGSGQIYAGSIAYRSTNMECRETTHVRSLRPVVNVRDPRVYSDRARGSSSNGSPNWPKIPDMQRGDFVNLLNVVPTFHGPDWPGACPGDWSIYFRFSGDGPTVRDLVAELPGIGKRTAVGFGAIACDEDGRAAIHLHEIHDPAAGIPGLVRGDGEPERAIPLLSWRALRKAQSATQEAVRLATRPIEAYERTRVPRWRVPPEHCVVPSDLFGYLGAPGYGPPQAGGRIEPFIAALGGAL